MCRFSIRIFKSEYDFMLQEVARFPNIETGGGLFGTFTYGNIPVIWYASGPGPKSHRRKAEFQPDLSYLTEMQRTLMKEFGIQYIGSWHSHHRLNLPYPSHGDVEGMRRYAVRHHRHKAIEIIAVFERENIILRPYFYHDALNGNYDLANFAVMERDSPVRLELERTSLIGATDGNFKANMAASYDGKKNLLSFQVDLHQHPIGKFIEGISDTLKEVFINAFSPQISAEERASYPISDAPSNIGASLNNRGQEDLPDVLIRELENLGFESMVEPKEGSIYLIEIALNKEDNCLVAVVVDTSGMEGLHIYQVNYINRQLGINKDITGSIKVNTKDKRHFTSLRRIYLHVKNSNQCMEIKCNG